MSISSKIFESVSFKTTKELKEGQKSEEFIADLKTALRSVANGNTIAGYPTPDGAILNFTIDHIEDSKIAENIDKIIAEIFPDYIANTNVDGDDILDNVMVEVSRKEDRPEGDEDVNEAGANIDLKAGVDIPDELAGTIGTALLAASEEKECDKNEDKEKLEELDPVTVGVIGAGLGAVAGSALTGMAKKNDESEEVTETTEIVVDDNGDITVATDEENINVVEEVPCEDGDIACDGEEEIEDEPNGEVAPETVEPDEDSVKEAEDVDQEIKDFLESAYEEEELNEIGAEKEIVTGDVPGLGNAEESDKLEEIEPITAGIIGAGLGAVAGNLLTKGKKETEEITEEEVPASKADFAHTQFDCVTEVIKNISELKAQDTENSLYTDLLKAYDAVQKILKDYISEQPVTTTEVPAETPAEPVEEPTEVPEEVPSEEVVTDIENTEIEGE